MSRFANALKNDLYDAEDMASFEGDFNFSSLMGKLADVVEAFGKLIKSDMLTPIEEMDYFRNHLTIHLDWEKDSEAILDSEDRLTDEEVARAQKIINDLTATDHLHNL